MLKKIFLILIASAITLTSCKEELIEDQNPIRENNGLKLTNSITWTSYNWEPECSVDPANSSNPVDYIGQEHNDKLDYIADQINSLTYTITSSVSMQNHLYDILYVLENDIGNYDHDTIIKNDYNDNLEELADSYYDFIDNHSESQSSADLKIGLLEGVYLDTDGDSLQTIIDYIKTYEASVISGSYTMLEKEDFLMYSSITRYSMVYFYDVKMGLRSDWNSAGYGGSETDPIVAADGVKSPGEIDAARREKNKYEKEVSNIMNSYAIAFFDLITEGGAWIFGQLSDLADWLENKLENLV